MITVDPARRLKDALGLHDLSINPRPVALSGTTTAASCDALALDAKRTFDTLIERFAASPEAPRRIFDNRLYQELSNGLGGSAEYMAMEKLHELLHQERYEMVVVDTPPSTHARDLLDAPLRLLELSRRAPSASEVAGVVPESDQKPASRASDLLDLLKAFERWTGIDSSTISPTLPATSSR